MTSPMPEINFTLEHQPAGRLVPTLLGTSAYILLETTAPDAREIRITSGGGGSDDPVEIYNALEGFAGMLGLAIEQAKR